jgi:DNA-binding NarL/FixJ family response regulator
MEKKIKILIVDDHLMFLEGLKSLLHNEQSIQIVGVASNGQLAIKFLENHEVDIVISDVSMPEIDGYELIAQIKRKYPKISTLILSMHSEAIVISKLIKLEINGYLLKNAEKEELLKAIHLISAGENYFSEEVKKIYMENSFARKKNKDYVPELSRREKDVLKLIVDGYTAKEIAEKLFISQHTVESHRKNIFSKLNIKNVAGLVKYALENNILD